jgi:hypothetical protein
MRLNRNCVLILLRLATSTILGTKVTAGCLVFFGLTVPIRWLLLGLLISVVALVLVAGAVVRYIRRHRNLPAAPELAAKERRGEE